MKLHALVNSVWHADDWFSGSNCNPMNNEYYLFGSFEDAEQYAKQLDVDSDFFNDGTIYTADVDEETILELSGCETIECFNEMLAEPYSNVPRMKSYGEDEKACVAEHVQNISRGEAQVDCANYDFDKSLEGAILVVWNWQRYVGYARECECLRYASEGETEKLLTKEDKSFVSQVDIVMTAEEVAQAGDDLQLQLYDRLHEESWRWQNVGFVETLIQLF